MTIEELFKRSSEGKFSASLLLKGDDVYLAREWKKLLVKNGFEVATPAARKTGPEADAEEASQSNSLFGGRTLVWLRTETSLAQWKPEAERVWQRMRGRADGESLVVVFQVPSDKRMKWTALACDEEVSFEIAPERRPSWIQRMAKAKRADLDQARQRFLAELDADLLTLDNYVELWALGGDIWAASALGWGLSNSKLSVDSSQNPAFAWVDAVLNRDRKMAARYLKLLFEEGQEPLQLLGLLNKSVRILASIEGGGRPAKQPPFLLEKLRRLTSNPAARGRGTELLKKCALLDRQLKSTAMNAKAALLGLC